MHYQILPSLLSADWMHLGDEITAVMDAGADMIHFDVMDNHYVPNLTFGPVICQAVRQYFPTLGIDVHLMATPIDDLIQQFAAAGATRISIHPEATFHLDRSLQLISQKNCKVGLVLNPTTPTEYLSWCVHRLDFVLIMTVNPGFSGQTLIPEIIKKIEKIHHQYPDLAICVDGGITVENLKRLAFAGATQFVAGSAIFNAKDYSKIIKCMREQLIARE